MKGYTQRGALERKEKQVNNSQVPGSMYTLESTVEERGEFRKI